MAALVSLLKEKQVSYVYVDKYIVHAIVLVQIQSSTIWFLVATVINHFKSRCLTLLCILIS